MQNKYTSVAENECLKKVSEKIRKKMREIPPIIQYSTPFNSPGNEIFMFLINRFNIPKCICQS